MNIKELSQHIADSIYSPSNVSRERWQSLDIEEEIRLLVHYHKLAHAVVLNSTVRGIITMEQCGELIIKLSTAEELSKFGVKISCTLVHNEVLSNIMYGVVDMDCDFEKKEFNDSPKKTTVPEVAHVELH